MTAVSPAVATGELDGARRVARAHRHRARDRPHRRARPPRLPRQRPGPLLLLQVRALRRARAAGARPRLQRAAQRRQPGRPGRLAAGPESRRRARRRAPAAATRARPRCASSPARFEPPQRREARVTRAWPRGSPTAPRSTRETLRQIDEAERNVKALGFPVLRVRHHGIMGRLEVAQDDLRARARRTRPTIIAAIKAAGYRHAVIDPEPFRSGRLNAALVRPAASR